MKSRSGSAADLDYTKLLQEDGNEDFSSLSPSSEIGRFKKVKNRKCHKHLVRSHPLKVLNNCVTRSSRFVCRPEGNCTANVVTEPSFPCMLNLRQQ